MMEEKQSSLLAGQPVDDSNRLAALAASGLLDSPEEDTFDRFTRLASRLLSCPVSLVSLVDRHRQFFKSSIGLNQELAAVRETPLSHSFCQHVVTGGQPLVIPNAPEDPRVRDNLAIPQLGVIAYLGVPIRSDDGYVLGSFCVIDGQTRAWSEEDLALLEDLGKALASEIRLRERTREMEKLLQEQLEREAEQEKLVHLLVHDLRSPLSAVTAGLELLGNLLPEGQTEEQELLGLARTGTDDLLELVNQILEVYRMRSGRLELQPQPLEINELLRSIFRQMLPAFETAGQDLQVHYAPQEIKFSADRNLIRRVIFNLLSNANKYSGPGSRVILQGWTSADKVHLAVQDNGPGIPAEHRASIFDLFGRGDTRRHASSHSFGLGLAFCRLVAEAHGGNLSLESPPEGGCSFCLSLPLAS